MSTNQHRCGYCPPDGMSDAVCGSCGFRLRPGHEGRHHRGFVHTVDPTGAGHVCDLCTIGLISDTLHHGFTLTILLDVPVGLVTR